MKLSTLLIALLMVSLTPVAGRAETVPDKAKALAERGRQLQHDGNYAGAIEAYKAAYVLAPSPGLLFNLAQSYRLAGDCDDAAWMYHRYLESQPTGETRDVATAQLARLEACTRGGFRTALVSARGATVTHTPTPELASPDRDGHLSKRVGTGLLIGGGGALLVSAILAVDAYNTQNAVEDAYANHSKPSDIRALDENGQRNATIAKVFGIGGGISVLSGAVLYGMGRHYERANHVSIAPHSGGATVSLSWGF